MFRHASRGTSLSVIYTRWLPLSRIFRVSIRVSTWEMPTMPQAHSPAEVADYAETMLAGTGGIGRYDGFTHVDVRQEKGRWRG